MTEDQLFEQHDTLTSMVRGLVMRTEVVSASLLGDIMAELVMMFRHAPPVSAAAPAWQLLQTLMRGEGSWQEKAALLNRQEVLRFLNSLWEIYEATAHAYYNVSR